MLNIRTENVISFNKRDMEYMMKDVSDGMKFYSQSKAQGVTKKDFLDFITNKDKRK